MRRATGRKVLTEEQHLDLVALQHLVALELVLNLLIPLLPLLLFCAHSATHGGVLVWCVGGRLGTRFVEDPFGEAGRHGGSAWRNQYGCSGRSVRRGEAAGEGDCARGGPLGEMRL